MQTISTTVTDFRQGNTIDLATLPFSVTETANLANDQIIVRDNGNPVFTAVSSKIPSYQVVTPGGDTALVTNFEYRIPIFGPVTLAAFFDAGMNRLVNTNQLKLNPDRITQLNTEFPGGVPDEVTYR